MHQIKKGSLTYYGQIDESTGQPHGIGRMTFNCSSIYEGIFVDGVRKGFGRMITVDNCERASVKDWKNVVYTGLFKENDFSG
jgi:hypothetical protein